MKLYFVRHGESEANLLHEFSNRGLKHGLTDAGRQQAASLAQTLRGTPILKLFSSPLLRAIQTTEILSRTLAIPFELTGALREYDCGVLEGKSDEASWRLYTEVFEAWVRHGAWQKRIEQGESFLDIKARFVPFIERLSQEYQHSPEGIVLVGHGGLYRCMLPLVLVNIEVEFAVEQPINHTSVIAAELRSEGLVCLSWGDVTLSSS